MKKKNPSHSSESMRTDGKRFNFLSGAGKKLDVMLQKVNDLMDLMRDSKPYRLDYKDIDKGYQAHGVGDIDEFASSYVFGWSMKYGYLNDKPIKQAAYEEVRDYLWKKKERGEIL
ncbi:hypothetical protein [Maribacter polysaccharolyticus]|uniref:hypothetical protein n=1 Tax=Maribacter polysaccharolyticus TaxID=3020831 RepID=UPI00237F9674|nr:hypothetical protein [Maribacter polysaccharolyticus]MDE3744083.1 hypothetical protein [Maribacter polysaccharolyticus]